jgi:hypothetical protein
MQGIHKDTVDSKSGFRRYINAGRFNEAKKRVQEYTKATGPDCTATKPADIQGMEKLLNKHKDHSAKAKASIEMYDMFPFLLHTNWGHDDWECSDFVQAREMNQLIVKRSLGPVHAAAEAMLKGDDRGERVLRLVTSAIRTAYIPSPVMKVDDNEVQSMKTRLTSLLKQHTTTLPLDVTTSELAKMDMMGLFLAVLANVWYQEPPNNTPDVDLSFHDRLKKAEKKRKVSESEIADLLAALTKHYDEEDNTDIDEKAQVQKRVTKIVDRNATKVRAGEEDCVARDKKSRKRFQTDRFGQNAPIEDSPPKKKQKHRTTGKDTSKGEGNAADHQSSTSSAWKKNDSVVCLKQPNRLGWFSATILRAKKNGTYKIRLVFGIFSSSVYIPTLLRIML